MIKHTIVTAFLIAAGALASVGAGCELVTSVDRSKLEGNGGYGGTTTTTTTTTTTAATCSGGEVACTVATDCPGHGACVADTCNAGCCGSTNVASGTACTSPGGTVCDGAGNCVACVTGTDCAAPATACLTSTCDPTAHTCGTADAPSGTHCTDNGGTACDGHGKCAACAAPTDCAPQATACILNTCTANACGTTNAASGAACTDHGGKVCDGNGNCVACNAPTDCAPQTTLCLVNACNGNFCGTTPTSLGTACTDSGGVVCDGFGSCVSTHCTDGVKDADETDADCGGATCAPCGDNLMCKLPRDCQSGDCKSLVCTACTQDTDCQSGNYCDSTNNGGTCTPTRTTAGACTAGNQCASGFCASGVCCNAACTGTCQACTMALTGSADGTCASVTPGTAEPNGQCTANPPCGNDGNCAAGGTCELTPNGTALPSGQQVQGNCQQLVCDGSGNTTSIGNATNLPTSTSACLTNPACSGTPLAPSFTPAPTGTACTSSSDPSAGVCGDTTNASLAGTCVECNTDADCLAVNDAGTLTCNTSTGTCM
jgi:hypothetical protein